MVEKSYRLWRSCEEDALAIDEIMTRALPHLPRPLPGSTLMVTSRLIQGIEDGAWLALDENKPIGVVIVSLLPDPRTPRIAGGVLPEYQRKGVGRQLLENALNAISSCSVDGIRAQWFNSNARSSTFMQHARFEIRDRIFWSQFDLSSPNPARAVEAFRRVDGDGIRICDAVTFKTLREDWAEAWWRLSMGALRDIPSDIPVVEIPFETFRAQLLAPDKVLPLTLFALDGVNPVGEITLMRQSEANFNIQTTCVERGYRRRGISLALKSSVMNLARSHGGVRLTTQNHQRNPMLMINRSLDFKHLDTQIDGYRAT